jgi:hypothetical protein
VALQIRQNNRLIMQNTQSLRASAFQEALRDQADAMNPLNVDAELNRIWFEGARNFESLSREDQRRFAIYVTSTLRRLENLLYQSHLGTLELELLEGVRKHYEYVFVQPGFIAWWKQARDLFNPQLREFVERDHTNAA